MSAPTCCTAVLPNTAIFVGGSVMLTFFIAFTLAWLVERTDLPWRTTIFTAILFPLLVPGIVSAIAWILLFAPQRRLGQRRAARALGLDGDRAAQHLQHARPDPRARASRSCRSSSCC